MFVAISNCFKLLYSSCHL